MQGIFSTYISWPSFQKYFFTVGIWFTHCFSQFCPGWTDEKWDTARDHRLSAVPRRAPPAPVHRQRVNDDGNEERSRLGFSVRYFDSIQRLKSHRKGSKGPVLCLDWYPISWGPDVATSTALGFIVYSANREGRNRWLKKESVGRRPLVFAPACCERKRSLLALGVSRGRVA
jgi:hypothetical protein